MIFPNDNHLYDDERVDDTYDSPEKSGRSRLRVTLFAAVMIAALLGGLILQAWSAVPALLGYWHNDYSLSLTQVLPGDCTQGEGQSFDTGRALCICGTLDAQGSKADFDISIRTQEGASLGKIALRDQSSGSFCHAMHFKAPLEPGRYVLVGTPRMGRNTIVRASFTVPENRPTF